MNARDSEGNSYTVTIQDTPAALIASSRFVQANVEEAIRELSRYIRWKGKLDFVVRWDIQDTPGWWTSNGRGFAAYGGIDLSGRTYAMTEAITGADANGNDYDLGTWVSPYLIHGLFNYGEDVHIDPTPIASKKSDLGDKQDFYSIFLHETLHGLGFWSNAQHGLEPTSFDKLTEQRDGQWYFSGSATVKYYGDILPLAATGSRDHFSSSISNVYNINKEFGNYLDRWYITGLELAVLKDLGYELTSQGEYLLRIQSHLRKSSEYNFFKLGEDRYGLQVRGQSSVDEITGLSVLAFADKRVSIVDDVKGVFDQLTGKETQDAQMYRLYNAAFARFPDASGLRYWINEYTTGVSSYRSIAQSFLNSEEFKSQYGVNNTNEDFVNNMYKNILGRLPDADGLRYWVTNLDTGRDSRVNVLGGFSESTENKTLFSQVTGFF